MALLHIICFVISLGYATAAQPVDPKWPTKFQQTFKETFYYPVIGTHHTTGTIYYDWANRRYRIDRANGRFDRYCGFNGIRAFQNTPCTHLVLNGWRWLIYPEKKACCRCCNSASGCDVLKPTWLTGAKFISAENGVYKWDQPGLQSHNYFSERSRDRVMTQINQVPNDIQDFDPDSLKMSIENEEEIFKLPTYCKVVKCSLASTCRAVG